VTTTVTGLRANFVATKELSDYERNLLKVKKQVEFQYAEPYLERDPREMSERELRGHIRDILMYRLTPHERRELVAEKRQKMQNLAAAFDE